jgi:hypothetical protein
MNAKTRIWEVTAISAALALLFVLMLVWPQPASAQDMPPVGLPRHEPGHLARVRDLDVRVAAGQASDPLAGNTILIDWDKIAMVFRSEDNKYTHKTYDVDTGLGNPVAKERVGSVSVAGKANLDIAAGYFTGATGWIDTVAAWESPERKIQLYVESYNSSLAKSQEATVNTGDVVVTDITGIGARIRVATGDFDGDGYDEFVVAWEGSNSSLNLRVWDTNGGITPTAKGTIAGETLQGEKFFGLTTGDFNADGKDEIAVVWTPNYFQVQYYLGFKLYSVGSTGNLVAEAKVIDSDWYSGQPAITAGDFNGDGSDEIAVASSDGFDTHVDLYQVTNNLDTLVRKGRIEKASRAASLSAPPNTAIRLGLGVGDFDGDGIDEVALVDAHRDSHFCDASVLSSNADLGLTLRASKTSTWLYCYGELAVAVGDMNRDAVPEIVAGAVPGYYGGGTGLNRHISVGVFQVARDLASLAEKGHISDERVAEIVVFNKPTEYGHMAIAVGAYDGKGVRVGTPAFSNMEETLQLVAVIHAPPKHRDVVNGQTIDVNVTDPAQCIPGPCTYAAYQTTERNTTTMSLTSNRDWSVSEEAKLKFPFVEFSLKSSYGESFEKTTTSFASREFGQDVIADMDDAIVRLDQSLSLWEYPVYADGTDVVQGYILVVWPDKTDPACTSNCSAAITHVIAGKNPTSRYLPNHEIFDVMSYSMAAPADISTTVKSDTKNDLGANGYHWWVKWTDIETDKTKQSNKLDLESSLEVSAFGQSLTTSGSYGEGETTVNKVSFEQSTELHLYFWGISGTYSYGVQPFIYFAKPDGHLVLDYKVTPLTSTPTTPKTWWENTYNKPDPTFNLPWKDGEQGDEYRALSREITFDPPSAAPDTIVTITAKIRNYTLYSLELHSEMLNLLVSSGHGH